MEQWKAQIEGYALQFSVKMREDFVKAMSTTRKMLPKIVVSEEETLQNQIFHVETFIDYLVSAAVSIASTYVTDSKEFEKLFVDQVKSKFSEMRDKRRRGELS